MQTTETEPSGLHSTRGGVNLPLVCFLVLIFVAACGFWTIYEPFGRDQGIHATIAYALRNGYPTYREVYNVKPPLTTGVYYLSEALFGHSEGSIRWLDLLVVAITCCCLARLLALLRFGRSAVLLSPLVFVAHYYSLDFWTRAQTDGWAAFLCVFSLFWMVMGWRRRQWHWFFLSGCALGLAFAMKYTVAGLGLTIFLPLLVRDDPVHFTFGGFATFIAGGLAALGVIVAVLVASGSLIPFLEIQQFVYGYTTLWRLPWWELAHKILIPLQSAPFTSLVIAASVSLLLYRLVRGSRRLTDWLFAIWSGTALLSYWVQAKGFSYQLLPFLLAASASTALTWEFFSGFVTLRFNRDALTRITAALAVSIGVQPLEQSVPAAVSLLYHRKPNLPAMHFQSAGFSTQRNAQAARRLAGLITRNDTLFVWGYETLLYYLSDRPPMYRYPYSWPFVVSYYDERYTDDLLRRLKGNPPDVFVVEYDDAAPWVTGELRDSRQMLGEFPGLKSFLMASYVKADEVEGFEIWRRKR
ncbi:glycosyltransferase family 39 protein [Novosphingobium sp. 2580]|uniref:Glycosyltransferase family 39 protein n=1 Tax=Novosphingobium album (ex Hu et al. 2023) TaxID=2930093 RepID=A0ABT0B106_9SPHN|nr:glycosyltransferase family 39 protein [Novosphingobium album (ex Hu et al. 2023)]MCJ2178606.1 glycosyltransferase family 39 protein [Novosphingobium album (ex Hu et al. 2023)]